MYGVLLVGLAGLKLGAEIGRWCFGREENRQIQRQRDIVTRTEGVVNREREKQHVLEREAARSAGEHDEAAREAHRAMLGEMRDAVHSFRRESREVKTRFEQILFRNRSLLQTLPLTPQQQVAIHQCNDQLERGVARLDAYAGPYLQEFEKEIRGAIPALYRGQFVTPRTPAAFLPEDFPYAGELFEFKAGELADYPQVDLGEGQTGCFLHPFGYTPRRSGRVVGGIQRYDRDAGCWVLSEAEGELALDLRSGAAFRQPRTVVLAGYRGSARVAWWRHASGELLKMEAPAGCLSPKLRQAPAGTPVRAYVHRADFRLRQVEIGDQAAQGNRTGVRRVECVAAADFWEAYRRVAAFSRAVLLRESSEEECAGAEGMILRLAGGQEFPVRVARGTGTLEILPQCGMQMGLPWGQDRPLMVHGFCGEFVAPGRGDLRGGDLLAEVEDSFQQQRELSRLDEADMLELEKYGTVLQAEFEALQRKEKRAVNFTGWREEPHEDGKKGGFGVRFATGRPVAAGNAVRLAGDERVLGWTRDGTEGVDVEVLPRMRGLFRAGKIPRRGTLEVVAVERDLQNKLAAIGDFRTAGAAALRTPEEQRAFTRLRRELMGRFEHAPAPKPSSHEAWPATLDAHQQRAVGLLAGSAPLVLIQGPPGTGKTHVIAHGIARLLKKNPRARIALVAQSNPAVDEAVAKIQESFPELVLYRDLSVAAQEKYAERPQACGLEACYTQVVNGLQHHAGRGEDGLGEVRRWLLHTLETDGEAFKWDLARARTAHSQVTACTLSRLAAIAASAPAFDLVIVDEAAKASVPEALIAVNCAKRLALVGDQNQLLPFMEESFFEHSAPTSRDAENLRKLWNDSLFCRLWNRAPAHRKAFLAVMRRSRRPVAECISACFYEGALVPGRDHQSASLQTPVALAWVDSSAWSHTMTQNASLENEGEAECVLRALMEVERVRKKPVSVAVIAFHRGQVALLRRKLREHRFAFQPEVLTVDASQGGQWDVVLLSLGRSSGKSGFVGNANRLNVALSRARELCVFVGSLHYARNDRTPGSRLAPVADWITRSPGPGRILCVPGAPGSGPSGIRFL
jgi:ATP-dependent RNA/DNA helicase IGHMBP2